MKLSLLQNKITSVQNRYAELLSSLLPKMKTKHLSEALDEINLFWVRNINIVKLYLKTMFPGQNSYVFTAATYMDIDDMEHLPFLLIGDKHVLDDPLNQYAAMHHSIHTEKDLEYLYQQIEITAQNNLKLLKSVKSHILILPLRLLNQSISQSTLFSIGEQAFTNLFVGINSVHDYFEKCNSIEDIIRYSHSDMERLVIFSEEDDRSLSFEHRFKSALSENDYVIDPSKSDAYNFFILVFGRIQQGIDIIMSCVEYECIPYIRYPIALHYISVLLESMMEVEHLVSLQYRMVIAFITSQLCDKEKLATVSFEKFLTISQEYHFSDNLFNVLNQHGINKNNYHNYRISDLVNMELNKFYDKLMN